MKVTIGQLADIIKAAEVLAPLDNSGLAKAFKERVADMTTFEIHEITQHITVIRRVAREWNGVELELAR